MPVRLYGRRNANFGAKVHQARLREQAKTRRLEILAVRRRRQVRSA